MEEPTFLQDSRVTVTKTRLAVPGQTYPVNIITSVGTARDAPKKGGPIATIVIGALMTLGGFSAGWQLLVVGLLVVKVGALWFMALKPTFHLVLTTAASEKRAFSSKNGEHIGNVVNAVNQAIIARG